MHDNALWHGTVRYSASSLKLCGLRDVHFKLLPVCAGRRRCDYENPQMRCVPELVPAPGPAIPVGGSHQKWCSQDPCILSSRSDPEDPICHRCGASAAWVDHQDYGWPRSEFYFFENFIWTPHDPYLLLVHVHRSPPTSCSCSAEGNDPLGDRKSTRLNSSHSS